MSLTKIYVKPHETYDLGNGALVLNFNNDVGGGLQLVTIIIIIIGVF